MGATRAPRAVPCDCAECSEPALWLVPDRLVMTGGWVTCTAHVRDFGATARPLEPADMDALYAAD